MFGAQPKKIQAQILRTRLIMLIKGNHLLLVWHLGPEKHERVQKFKNKSNKQNLVYKFRP